MTSNTGFGRPTMDEILSRAHKRAADLSERCRLGEIVVGDQLNKIQELKSENAELLAALERAEGLILKRGSNATDCNDRKCGQCTLCCIRAAIARAKEGSA